MPCNIQFFIRAAGAYADVTAKITVTLKVSTKSTAAEIAVVATTIVSAVSPY